VENLSFKGVWIYSRMIQGGYAIEYSLGGNNFNTKIDCKLMRPVFGFYYDSDPIDQTRIFKI
jgi:hypothetical protein